MLTPELDHLVDQWHKSDGILALHEFLKVSYDNYILWLEGHLSDNEFNELRGK